MRPPQGNRHLLEQVSKVEPSKVEGTFYRFAARGRDPIGGSMAGRWSQGFPVIYLGSPEDSIVIEAYRHFVEDAGLSPSNVHDLVVYRAEVNVDGILDLTSTDSASLVGLDAGDLRSPVGDYGRCQAVAAAAHQLQFAGILAPAAAGNGLTLALFKKRLGLAGLPELREDSVWQTGLPPDPRAMSAEVTWKYKQEE